jgi:hypothetical protein
MDTHKVITPDPVDDDIPGPPHRYHTSDPSWLRFACEDLLYEEDVVIDGHYIRAHSLHPRRPVMRQLRRILRQLGVRPIRAGMVDPDRKWRREVMLSLRGDPR